MLEMMVVMSIIAILSTLGISGWLSLRNSSQVDAVTEELVSAIREAQSNSIGVKEGPGCTAPATTKGWFVNMTKSPSDFKLRYFCGKDDGADFDMKDYNPTDPYLSSYKQVDIRQSGCASCAGYVFFSTPFGTGYVSKSGYPGDFKLDAVTRQAADWTPSAPTNVATSQTTWIVSKNGYQRLVIIEANGDVSAQ